MPGQRGRRHLAAGHAVDGVVDEDHGDVLTAQRGVHDLGQSDRGQIPIALVGENNPIGQHALHAGRHRGRAAMRRFDKIDFKIVVAKHGAAHRRDADGVFTDAQLVDHFGDQAVRHAVRAARAVMGVHVA